jgi:hypothetical protein
VDMYLHFPNTKDTFTISFVIATGYGLDNRSSWVRFPAGMGIFLFSTASRPVLESTQPPIRWVPGTLSPGVKRPGRETIPPAPYVFMEWCLDKHKDNLTLSYLIH